MAKIKVTVERINGYCNSPHLVGDYFFIDGSRLIIPEGGHVCLWALQSMMPVFPILAVKNRLVPAEQETAGGTWSRPEAMPPRSVMVVRLERAERR